MAREEHEPAPGPERHPSAADPDNVTLLLQALSSEHANLAATRAMAWNESFSRAGMFVSTLSFATVALALAAQSGFGTEFRVFALVILPVVLFLGVGTLLRLDAASYYDLLCIVGMNRIRAAYLELAPRAERYLVMGANDDVAGIETTMGTPPWWSFAVTLFTATPFQLAVLNAVIAAAIVSLAALQVGAGGVLALFAGVGAFVVGLGAYAWYSGRLLANIVGRYRPRFPSAEATREGPAAPPFDGAG